MFDFLDLLGILVVSGSACFGFGFVGVWWFAFDGLVLIENLS